MSTAGWRVVAAGRRLRELPADLLDRFARPSAYSCRGELSSLEGRTNVTSYLMVVDDRDAPVAFVPVYGVSSPPMPGYDPGRLFGLTGFNGLLLVGSVGSYVNHLMFRPGLPAEHRAVAAGALIRQATLQADQAGIECVSVPCLDPRQAAAVRRGGPAGCLSHREPRAVVDIAWASFEQYRDSMTRKPRATVRNERRAFEPVRHELAERPLAGVCEELAPLLTTVERKYGQRYTSDQMTWYLRTISRTMGEHGRALVLSRDDRPAAFSVVWQHPEEWHVRTWGCDYGVVGEHAEYANVVFYEPIERAIGCGVPRVHFGPGSLRAKVLRGARLEDLVTALVRPAAIRAPD